MCPRQWSNTSSVNKGYYSIASDHRGSLSPFYASVGCSCQMQIPHFPKMVTPLAWAKDPFFQPTFPFLCSQLFHVQGLDLAMSALSRALVGVMYMEQEKLVQDEVGRGANRLRNGVRNSVFWFSQVIGLILMLLKKHFHIYSRHLIEYTSQFLFYIILSI